MGERNLYRAVDMQRLIDPKVIAVVGASETPGSPGHSTMANLAGFSGKVFAVNPKYTQVQGRPCVPTLMDLPESPDCVALCVARPLVEESVRLATSIGAGGTIVYASGYAETGLPDRKLAQQMLVDIAQAGGVRLVGPNTIGIANATTGAVVNFMIGCAEILRGPPGHVGIITQSGALGYSVLQSVMRGVRVSHYLAAGNSADVDVCDYLAYLADQDQVRAIICLFEGVKSGKRFLEAARLADRAGKALIVHKAGNTEASGKAALSHTGTLVGSVAGYRAAFEAVGAIHCDNLESVLEMACLFAKAPRPKAGRGVGIMATSGGAGVVNADKAEEKGLSLPQIAPATRAALEQVVPEFGAVANPADITSEALRSIETFTRCLRAFADDPSFSAVVVPFVYAHPVASGARAPVLSEVAASTDSLIAAVWMPEWLEGPGSQVLEADPRVALFRSSDRAFEAIRAWFDWHERRARADSVVVRLSSPDAAAKARAILAAARAAGAASAAGAVGAAGAAGARGAAGAAGAAGAKGAADATGVTLTEQDSKSILTAYGIAVPQDVLAQTPQAAAEAAARMGFPVVVKIASPDIPHKTEVQGIRLNLRSTAEVSAAAAEIDAAARRARPAARINGVSVQTMVPAGHELVMGLRIDRQFGPLVMVGSGGILVELLADAVTALAPVSRDQATRMIRRLRSYELLRGYRGRPACDFAAAIDVLCRLSELASDLAEDLTEADINPVIVSLEGAVAADALIVAARK
jgi:acyl-CoA synthetase (NDP forming)